MYLSNDRDVAEERDRSLSFFQWNQQLGAWEELNGL